jgi:hypothetical protein
MNDYNDRWTREKFLEYRKLKRNGLSHKMLIEHFGEDIYYSGLYNRKSNIMPWLDFITEITINPEYSDYNISKTASDIYINKFDYVIDFIDNEIKYVITLFYYTIDSIETYNILLTTDKQWNDYRNKINEIRNKGYITDAERTELVNIVEKETGYNQVYSILKKVSYILFDFIENNLGSVIISIGETKNIVKINLYRNIIKNSFSKIIDKGYKFDDVGNKYYLFSYN